MNQMQQEMWDVLSELSGEDVLRLMTDWHGLQILDHDFRDFLGTEGIMPELEDDEEAEADMEEEIDLDELLSGEFDEFCASFDGCVGCPYESKPDVDCEEEFKAEKRERMEK